MMKKFIFGDPQNGNKGLIDEFPLSSVDESYEPSLPFNTGWVQDYRNHHAILDCFWKHIQPKESLVFFYAKQVPLAEDTGRRVIVGVGRVNAIKGLTEYNYKGDPSGKIRSLLWERMVVHSIRPNQFDGFLLPYHEALEKCDEGRNFDPAEVVAYAPEDRFEEFSYATELVSHDSAISSLLSCKAALARASELFNISIRKQEEWIDNELGRLWKKRGPFPGMGALLASTGIRMGYFMAQHISEKAADSENPWSIWESVLDDPINELPQDLANCIDDTIAKSWKKMPDERRKFLQLLSRIDLTREQADIIAIPENRRQKGIEVQDNDYLRNPYLIYESARLTASPIEIGTVDRGLFPTNLVRDKFPQTEPTNIKTAVDGRRLRALVIRELESASTKGDTLKPKDDLIVSLRKLDDNRSEEVTPVTSDLLAVTEEEHFDGEIRIIKMANGKQAYQLNRYATYGDRIRSTILKRKDANRHTLSVDWAEELNRKLGELPEQAKERQLEARAREEKASALAELASSRFSVLIGPAGTGKTTLLSILCHRPEVSEGGILLLAPTGKARVRMEDVTKKAGISNYKAYTLAQFLSSSKRYLPETQRYQTTGEPGKNVGRTVIVDECSMFTEEMMAALLEAISGVHRLIFVGDPNQLPPIGAGRPFVDIVAELAPEDISNQFPRVSKAYAELTVPRRQGAGNREDLQLAAWFGGQSSEPGEDQVFEILSGQRESDYIKFIQWDTPDELESLLPSVLAENLGFEPDEEEWRSFSASLGGVIDAKGSAWFNVGWDGKTGAGENAEAWQILSPVRQQPWGTEQVNRFIHSRYKGIQIQVARTPKWKLSIPRPMGDSQIIYGDKVINNRNSPFYKKRIYPEPSSNGYLANGEIGMVVGHRRTKKKYWDPKDLEVEFSTQPKQVFKFSASDFSEEGNASIDLAYALTVHRAQGSEFGIVFLVLPKSPLLLTRELIYTALTRQKKRVVVLHQGTASDIQKLSSKRFSSSASRLTNLFRSPDPIEIRYTSQFLESRLIHITSRGEAVRSKSEVIIANMLHSKGINYQYELPLELGGTTKYPDFTIDDDDLGITYYWEHCGMLSDPSYAQRWEGKKAWYRENGILPTSEGTGPNGILIVTEDLPNGGIDSQSIDRLIARML
ncbi:AAA family ATPase [Pelagicoccus sp. SDUM812005]|uniref:AAA family ATPase n=1 Tax=Pelagicoccus sp. SDUM812005 TaxID=3041257 RepID=UPI0028119754|nr:AAA family ATPase [Pelagicoccus sp. SDUM812005]